MRQNVQFSVSQVGRRSATGWPESLSRRGSRLGRTANRWTDGQTGSTELPGKTSAPQGHSKNGLPARWSRSPCPCPSPCSAGPGPQPGRRTSTAGADPASREDGEREDTPPREAVAVGPCGSHRGGGLGGRGGGGASGPVAAVPLPCARAERRLCSAPLGGAGAGGVAVCRQDFVGDAAALPLVHPLLGAQVRGVLVFAGLFRCFAQAS